MPLLNLLFLLALGVETLWNFYLSYRNFRYYKRLDSRGIPSEIARFFPGHYDPSREIGYARSNALFGIFSRSFHGIVLGLFLLSGGFHLLGDWSVALGGSGWGGSLIFASLLLLGSILINLPFGVYHHFVLETRYGFAKGGWPVFLQDLLKSTLLGLGFSSLFFALLVAFTALPHWYLWGALFTSLVMVALTYALPLWIMPLFYHLTPLEESSLSHAIEYLLHQASFECSDIFVVDESKRSAHQNAMVAGLGESKRILLFDTLVETMDTSELLAVVAHEIGHGFFHHPRKRIIFGLSSIFFAFALGGLLWETPWVQDNPGTAQEKFALLLYVVGVSNGFLASLGCPFFRKEEFQADEYARKTVGKEPMGQALEKLASQELSWIPGDPGYLRWKGTHPSIPERLKALEKAEG